MIELSTRYSPKETEDKWYEFWEKGGFFTARPDPDKKPFTIVIPPPNVTGILHMGHALNNTLQDILIRHQRMKGLSALWMPGVDHAGIATQNVVEKKIAKEGLKRQDLGREKFIERVWEWKEEYGSTITRQLKKLGASCDWSRLRFTMDQEYSAAVMEVFTRLYEKGLIYRGNYIINWCPRCQTALSDEEAPHRELQGNLYYLKYPLKADPGEFIIVATTRPETMLGDTAVAVNPKDKRYKKYIGKGLILPLLNREIKVIADSMVDMKFGTGAVKVTPAHDPNDYALGKKHKLDFIKVMNPDGRMNEFAGDYRDMDRFEAREVILEDLKEQGFLDHIEAHRLSAGHCYRCHTIIEPYLSDQWFVKMEPLSRPAIEAVKEGRIKFYPARWKKVYLNWMENIQDWCISRQIWWGHRLPVYYCKDCQKSTKDEVRSTKDEKNPGVIVSRIRPQKCPVCGSADIYQDEDVLDTWFSSWLWPFATFYWPFTDHGPRTTDHEKELNYFYPTSVLVTAPEIIFFWVARMIMAGFEFMGELPFKDVYIHGTVRDVEGKKMSKSLGNVIDPLEIIDEFGCDALRFSLISITAQGQDVFLSRERFEQGRNFSNKIWNASRFIMMNLDPEAIKVDLCVFFKKEELDPVNRWILSRFYSVLKETDAYLEKYKFNEAANLLYKFFWHEFCDWYLELIKPRIKEKNNQVVMYKVLEKSLRLLHPFMPFITEEIWQKLSEATKSQSHKVTSIMVEPWPHLQENIIDKKSERSMEQAIELITTIRNIRSELEIGVTDQIALKICAASKARRDALQDHLENIRHLARVGEIVFSGKYAHQPGNFVTVLKDLHLVIPLAGVIDINKYKRKLDSRIDGAQADLKAKEKMLANKSFVERAPSEIVEKERVRLKEIAETLEKLKGVKDGIS